MLSFSVWTTPSLLLCVGSRDLFPDLEWLSSPSCQGPVSSEHPTLQRTSPSSTLPPIPVSPCPSPSSESSPPAKDKRGSPASDQDDSGIHNQSMDPDEVLLQGALNQVFETDWNVAQLSSQSHTLRVLAELQTLLTRIVSELALLNGPAGRDCTGHWEQPRQGKGHYHLEQPQSAQYQGILCLMQIMLPTRSLLANLPPCPPSHKCERCQEPDHLEIG